MDPTPPSSKKKKQGYSIDKNKPALQVSYLKRVGGGS